MAVAIAALAIDQAFSFFSGSFSVLDSQLGAILVPLGLFGLVPVVAWWEGRPWRDYGLTVRGGGPRSLAYVTLFALLFLTLRLEPGFVFGFGREPPISPSGFAFLLAYGPATALAQGTVFLGLLFRRLVRRLSFVTAAVVTSTFFALAETNVFVFRELSLDQGIEILFTTTLTAFVFGFVLSLYFYKAQWSLLGPVALQIAVIWILNLFPWTANIPNWEDAFASLLVAYGVLLGAVAVLLQEPRLQAHKYLGRPIGPRRYRFRDRAENRRALRDLGASAAVVVVVVLMVDVGLPAVAGTPSTPILAIATGSMVPTFHRGELVVIEKASPSQIHVGTIIAFHVSCLPAPTVHRVYKILIAGPFPVYLTKGDANKAPDPCDVPYSHVIGRAVVWVPYIGYLILDPLFAAALIVLGVVSMALIREQSRR